MKTFPRFLTLTSALVLSLGAAANAQTMNTTTAQVTTQTTQAQSAQVQVATDTPEQDMRDRQVQSYSKTTEVKTVQSVPATSLFMYDLNGNGTLEPYEVGTKLFYQFDRDGNQSLDNIEFKRKLSVQFEPIESIRILTVDYNNDGVLEAEEVETEVIMRKTGLERFSRDGSKGISPREFIGKSLLQLDTNKSGLVELDEWRKAYTDTMAPKNADNTIYNN